MTEPLHILVARAIGWDTDPDHHDRDAAENGHSRCIRCGSMQGWNDEMPALCVPRYDTDWSATGPLIEKWGIEPQLVAAGWKASVTVDHPGHPAGRAVWSSEDGNHNNIGDDESVGRDICHPTILLAACHVLKHVGGLSPVWYRRRQGGN